jgi:hypothetical protein
MYFFKKVMISTYIIRFFYLVHLYFNLAFIFVATSDIERMSISSACSRTSNWVVTTLKHEARPFDLVGSPGELLLPDSTGLVR